LRAWILEGDDSSVADRGWLDMETGQECQPVVAADQRVRCLPAVNDPSYQIFSDPSCRERAFLGARGCRAKAFAQQVASGCPHRATVRWRVPIDSIYEQREGACMLSDLARGERLFGLGTEIPAEHFPPFDRRVSTAPGRLQPVFVGAGDAETTWGFDDRELGEHCVAAVLGSTPHCIPHPHSAWNFADAACQVPVVEVAQGTCPPEYAVHPDPRGGYNLRAYRIGAARPRATLYHRDGASCEASWPDVAHDYFDLRPIPDSTFAPITGRWTHVGR
jgi:hypothetical protein